MSNEINKGDLDAIEELLDMWLGKAQEELPEAKEIPKDDIFFEHFLEGLFSDNEFEDETKEDEMVHHPKHYNEGLMETLEEFILLHQNRPDEIKGALKFNIFKYNRRAGKKGPKEEDEAKLNFYLDVLGLLYPEEISGYELYRQWKRSK